MNDPLQFVLALVVNHLWQSTLFAVAMGGLAWLLRRNGARVRYWLWLAASLKFLVPFALLAALGTRIPLDLHAGDQGAAVPQILSMAGTVAAPMTGELPYPQLIKDGSENANDPLPLLVAFFLWAAGAAFVCVRWLLRWIVIRHTLHKAAPVASIEFPVRVRATHRQLEPGVVGIFRPALLLPAGIEARLTPAQMRAVLAHERCHLQSRDNLTASLHMLVEALFWYFPLVWWIGARLIEERERACDEQVVREGHAPESYAEGILAVCEHYIASSLPCVSGVSGSDLRKRIERIVRNSLTLKLDGPKKLAVVAVACCAVTAPLAAGVAAGSTWQVMFSLNPSSTAMLDYFDVGRASDNLAVSHIRLPGFSAFPCAPDLELQKRQRVLAASVARLSPTDGKKVLLYAVAANSTPDVQRLLAGGASRDGDGFLRPHSLMHIAAQFGDARMLQTLADAGFSVDGWAGPFGRRGNGLAASTPLIEAIRAGRMDNAEWLIRHGADVNATNEGNHSALSYAMLHCGGQRLVPQLIQAGAKANASALRVAQNTGFDLRGGQNWRTSPKNTELAADFDGDGIVDRAELKISPDRSREGVFLKLSSRDAGRWIQVAEAASTQLHAYPLMGIEVVPPGTYATACAKGYGKPCAAGETAALTLAQPGIRFFMEEGASSIVYWDGKNRPFAQAWTSD